MWSLCVLQQAKPHYLQRALAPDFCARIQGETPPRAPSLQIYTSRSQDLVFFHPKSALLGGAAPSNSVPASSSVAGTGQPAATASSVAHGPLVPFSRGTLGTKPCHRHPHRALGLLVLGLFTLISAFFSPSPPADPSPKAQNLRVKLLHINATARLEIPEYQGPFLTPNLLGTVGSAGEGGSQLQGSLREALTGVLGGQDRARFDAPTIYGWQIGEHALSSHHQEGEDSILGLNPYILGSSLLLVQPPTSPEAFWVGRELWGSIPVSLKASFWVFCSLQTLRWW